MNFILKIVEGPNKGAEAVLVQGVTVTLGKGEDCDIVLADTTLPDAPIKVAVSEQKVEVDGDAIDPFVVKTVGATSFAIGPADSPWGELVWPNASHDVDAEKKEAEKAVQEEAAPPAAAEEEVQKDEPARRGGGCFGCLVALVLVLMFAAGVAWIFRGRARPYAAMAWNRAMGASSAAENDGGCSVGEAQTLESIAEKHGLSLSESSDGAMLSGNLKTRRERLLATAEAYQAQPGVSLDLSDDESLRMSAEDALFTLTEGSLKVLSATNRFLSIVGTTSSPVALKKILDSLNADLPKLSGVDVTEVRLHGVGTRVASDPAIVETEDMSESPAAVSVPRVAAKKGAPVLPVCGILTSPYPCLVMRDGRRVMEGSVIGDSMILRIDADSITVTNSAGRFVWKP